MNEVAHTIRRLLGQRSEGATICPSEVARALDADAWRSLMPLVRATAAAMAGRGEVVITQRGQPLRTPPPWRGPVRIGHGRGAG